MSAITVSRPRKPHRNAIDEARERWHEHVYGERDTIKELTMRLSTIRSQFAAKAAMAIAAGFLLIAFSACTPKPKASEETATQPASTTRTALADQFDGGTYCAQTFLQGAPPAQALHFSYKVTESDPSQKSKDYEADLSGDKLDLVHSDKWLATDADRKSFEESSRFTDPNVIKRSVTNGFAEETVTNHATRSDEVSWSGIVMSLTQGGTPWGLFILKPAVSRVGEENVNGYDTVKYTVDTTRESDAEKSAGLLRGLKDYNITGTAWVLKDAKCVLQYDITDQQTGKDGKSRTTHYEGSVTKK
jgi:hypothetical protein